MVGGVWRSLVTGSRQDLAPAGDWRSGPAYYLLHVGRHVAATGDRLGLSPGLACTDGAAGNYTKLQNYKIALRADGQFDPLA